VRRAKRTIRPTGPADRLSGGQRRTVAALAPRLLRWFAAHARDLPWRRTRDPYAIWVSEIMLQQTQVATVIPYWERWLRELPSIESVARADSARIHKLWEGLGYYTRVRNLQRAAQQIVVRHGGRFPPEFADVLALAGIGRYTAGAICSIAFNQPTPLLDGNVIRVLTRLLGLPGDPRQRETNAQLWQLAEALVRAAAEGQRQADGEQRACSQLNQALMELGALVCLPRAPRCEQCPAASLCVARAQGQPEAFPRQAPRPVATRKHIFAFVVHRRGRFLVRQRREGVVNAHLWEFPSVELDHEPATPVSVAATLFGRAPERVESWCVIQHAITRYRIRLEVFQAHLPPRTGLADGLAWRTLEQLEALAFSSAHRKIVNRLRAAG
jgi:A/G-specific adenine glycosylase